MITRMPRSKLLGANSAWLAGDLSGMSLNGDALSNLWVVSLCSCNEGARFFCMNTMQQILQYNLSTPYQLGTASASGNTLTNRAYDAIYTTPDGNILFAAFDYTLYRFDFATPGELNTVVENANNMAIPSHNTNAICFCMGGTRLYALGYAGSLTEYALSTAYDLSTASATGNSIYYGGKIHGMYIDESGEHLYVGNRDPASITYKHLATPGDISSIDNSVSMDPGFTLYGITFKHDDGSKLFAADAGGSVRTFAL